MSGAYQGSWTSKSKERIHAACSNFVHTQNINISGKSNDVTFSVTSDIEHLLAACHLINDRYAWRGYGSTHSIPVDAQHTTFTAEVDQVVVGTITLAIDSKFGLSIDSTFYDEANRARQAPGAQICELTKLAFDPSIRSREVMARLFHLVFIYGTGISECTDLFIEVNPRHTCFYEKMLGFERVGRVETNSSVNAPSQLMHLKVDTIRRSIREQAGCLDLTSNRSLYPFFFSPLEESKIRCSLAMSHIRSEINLDEFLPRRGKRSAPMDDHLLLSGSMSHAHAVVPTATRDVGEKAKGDIPQAA